MSDNHSNKGVLPASSFLHKFCMGRLPNDPAEHSLYSGDPDADFALDEFRIYNGALTAADIVATGGLWGRGSC